MKNENTNHVVKTVPKMLNVKVEDEHISTSHRLPIADQKTDLQKGETRRSAQPPPPIIVRFSNRDKRNEMFRQKNQLRSKSIYSSTLALSALTGTENPGS